MKKLTKPIIAGLALLLGASPCYSEKIRWNGFLSVVGGRIISGDDNSIYDGGFFGYDGGRYSGAKSSFEFNQESMIGLQGQAVLDEKLRATVQIIGRGGERFQASAEWAYLSYDLNNAFTLNVGKFRHPVYYYSDFLDVGYTYHWIRPPTQVYNGPSAMTGANLFYSQLVGDFYITSQAWFGSAPVVWDGLNFDVYNNKGINFTFGQDWWKLRAVYHTTDFNLYDPPGAPVGTVVENKLTYYAFAAIIETDTIDVIAEYTDMKLPNVPLQKWWYISAGYSIGDFTPHITYNENPNNPINPYGWAQSAEVLTYGVRWDFHPGVAFKAEYVSYDYEAETQADFDHISFGIDMLF